MSEEIVKQHNLALNRRAEVENLLIEVAIGKRPLPDRDECMVLALKLGTPRVLWNEKLKEHK